MPDPESAVRANQDLGGGILLPVHWATFNLSYHAWDEPILRTVRAAADQHAQLVTPRVGEVVEIGQPFDNVEWYRAGALRPEPRLVKGCRASARCESP
jgi:L-ascorbate metabolism protein UlaG (beta-lactamase superfamily)